MCIRANQGHSVAKVDPNLLLQRLDADVLESLPTIVRGTYKEAWDTISTEGLKRMMRNHIHFASGLPKEDGVISGMRKSCDVYVYIDAKKCAKDRVTFYRSENGVLLTAGLDDEGTLTVEYFSHAMAKKCIGGYAPRVGFNSCDFDVIATHGREDLLFNFRCVRCSSRTR